MLAAIIDIVGAALIIVVIYCVTLLFDGDNS